MGGILNVIIGALLAGVSWFGPTQFPEALTAIHPDLLNYADAGLIAGGAVAGVGVVELVFSLLGSAFRGLSGGGPSVSDAELDDVFKRAMVAMAAADGHLDAAELELVKSQLANVRAVTISASDIRAMSRKGDQLRRDVLRDIKKYERGLSDAVKRQFFEGAQWILRSDFEVKDAELKYAQDLAKVLRLDDAKAAAIADSVKERTLSAVKLAAASAAPAPAETPTPVAAPAADEKKDNA